MTLARLLLVTAAIAATSTASMSSMSTVVTPVMPTDGYKLALHIESYDAPLIYLAQFPINAGGAFAVSVDLAMPLGVPDGDLGRVLLYLLACDVKAMDEIVGLGSYCAMPNRTLADLCVSFPLPDRAVSDHMVYRAQSVVSGTAVRDLGIRSSNAGPMTFLLDACETVGGRLGVLRSCLDTMDSQNNKDECFYCPATGALPGPYANCVIPPEMQPTMSGGVWMNLCDSSGDCLTASSAFSTAYGTIYSTRASLPLFYAVATLIWGAASFVWSVHIQAAVGRMRSRQPGRIERARLMVRAARANGPSNRDRPGTDGSSSSPPSGGSDSGGRDNPGNSPYQPPPPPQTHVVIALQQKMRGVPISQCVSSALTAAVLYLEGSASVSSSGSGSTAHSSLMEFVTNAAIVSAVISIALISEMLLLLAKGWQITRAELPYRERQWLRVLSYVFGMLTCILRYAQRVKHVVVVLLWGASWALVVGSIWFYSALNLNALRYQLAVLRQHALVIQQHLAATNSNGSPPPPPPLDIRRTPVFVKLQLFRRFRALLASYLFASCIFSVAGLATDSTDGAWQWTTLAGGDGLTFLLAAAMGYMFRCRRFRELLPSENREAGPTAGGTRIVPEPVIAPPPELVRKKSAMVVVVNPDKERALGTSYTVERFSGEGDANGGGSPNGKKCAESRETNT